ncbi:MAG TPA: glycosyltransferase [Solirubrobacterales bacterium]|nr:glycosyltransferase [Solirubrobacterales bacterium]
MLQEVALGQKSLADYTHIAGREQIARIRELAEPLEGHRVLHVSATAFGGGVSEILYTLVPLMRDVGLDAHWHVIFGKEEFFNATKLLHNSLQGAEQTLSDEEWALFDEINALNSKDLHGAWDTIVVHDPQPIGLRRGASEKGRNWVWRCHIDLSEPNPAPIARLLPLIEEYDATVWHMPGYVPNGMNGGGAVRIVPPAIDPLSPKNMAFSPDDAAFVCHQFGIDVDRPLITQVSRFDPWKDPVGVIDAYREVTAEMPEVQLALVGSMATDDPEGWEFFQHTMEYAAGDEDIKILNNLNNVGAIEVNAFQSQSDVCVQKSIREGFGLTVTEALWKGRPMVAGNVGGIPLQINDGESGYLVDSPQQCAQRCLEVLADPELGKRLGRAFHSASVTVRPKPSRIDFCTTTSACVWNAFTSTAPTLLRLERMKTSGSPSA